MKSGKSYQNIVSTATDLFQKYGYHATGISEILKLSQTTRGSLYHYFPDGKEDLANAVLDEIEKTSSSRLKSYLNGVHDPVTEICTMFLDYADNINYTHSSDIMLLIEISQVSEDLHNKSIEILDTLDNILLDEVARAGLNEDITCNIASSVLSMLIGGLSFSVVTRRGSILRHCATQVPVLFSENGFKFSLSEGISDKLEEHE